MYKDVTNKPQQQSKHSNQDMRKGCEQAIAKLNRNGQESHESYNQYH